jgi:hypothetical protein
MFYTTLVEEQIELSNIDQFKLVILAEILVNMEVHISMYNTCKLKSKLLSRINKETF